MYDIYIKCIIGSKKGKLKKIQNETKSKIMNNPSKYIKILGKFYVFTILFYHPFSGFYILILY